MNTSPFLDVNRLKAQVIALWRRGGMDTPVKVMPKGMQPRVGLTAGFCTTFKYVGGRTPAEMELIVGFAPGTKLASGAEIYLVNPLPLPSQFELRGYSNTPAGIPTNDPRYRAHRDYPPGEGAPQWELVNYPQSLLQHIATVSPGERFSYRVANLPVPI